MPFLSTEPVRQPIPFPTATARRAGARLALSAVFVAAVAATATALRVPVETGSAPADQVVSILRTGSVALGVWLCASVLIALAASVSTGGTVSTASSPHPGNGAATRPTLLDRTARRIAPRWIRTLSERAVGIAVVAALSTSTALGSPANASTAPARSARSARSAAPAPQRMQPAVPGPQALADGGADTGPQKIRRDASGQQWPVIERRAGSPGSKRPAVTVTRPALPGPEARPAEPGRLRTPIDPVTTVAPTSTSTTSTTTTPTTTTSTSTTSTSPGSPTDTDPTVNPAATTPGRRFGPDIPARTPGSGPSATLHTFHTVRAGESFWSIAEGRVLSHDPGAHERDVLSYWHRLMADNSDRLPVPGNPDLLYPGTVLRLP